MQHLHPLGTPVNCNNWLAVMGPIGFSAQDSVPALPSNLLMQIVGEPRFKSPDRQLKNANMGPIGFEPMTNWL